VGQATVIFFYANTEAEKWQGSGKKKQRKKRDEAVERFENRRKGVDREVPQPRCRGNPLSALARGR